MLGVVDFLKVILFRGVAGVAASRTALTGLTSLGAYWTDTAMSLSIMFGGLYSNLVFLGLAILGLLVSGRKKFMDHYFEILLGLSSLVFLVGDASIKSRVLYNFPIGFLAAQGFSSVYRGEDDGVFKWLFTFFIASVMLAYLFRGLANIV